MYRWISWRNGRVVGLLFVLLFGIQPAVIALTSSPTATQSKQLSDLKQTFPPEATLVEDSFVNVSPKQLEDEPVPDAVIAGGQNWFPNRDCTQDLRVMPLGNSITAGVGSGTPPFEDSADFLTGYRYPLYQSLTNANYQFDFVGARNDGFASGFQFDYDNQGTPGQRIDQMNTLITGYLTDNPPDLILLHIGTNDVLQDDDPSVANLGPLLDLIDDFDEDIPIIIARIINEQELDDEHDHVAFLTAFNNNLQSLVDTRISNGDKLLVVDMEPILDYTETSPDFSDRWHPNTTGYAKMAQVWFPAMESIWPTCIPEITSTAPVTAVVDQPYTYDVDATADPGATYSLTGTIPVGMSIVSDTGEINWTPTLTQTGQFTIDVAATNLAGSDTQQFILDVYQVPAITSSPITTAPQGTNYIYDAAAAGVPNVTFSLPQAPTGMTIDPNSGVVTWSVPADYPIGSENVTVQASNVVGIDQQSFVIEITERFSTYLPTILK